ncbi:MAG: class I SAM-dependent methyltransferase [Patescibacteria group bacterium]|jgi:hypothetical protein
MNINFYSRKKLDKIINRKIKKTNVILDIGCGIRPQNFITPIVHICAEPFEQYVKTLQKIASETTNRNYVIMQSGWQDVIKILPEESVDTIFILDVIEHLDKNEGERLLKETEKIAKKQIIIFTPLGFLPQKSENKKDAWGMDGGDWQEHKSGWLPEDFDDSWDIHALKEYHFFDSAGIKYEKPYGAFYAIKTKKEKQTLKNKIIKKYFLLHNIVISRPITAYDKYKSWPMKLYKKVYGRKKI